MAGQFSAQESNVVFDLADSNGDGEGPTLATGQKYRTNYQTPRSLVAYFPFFIYNFNKFVLV